MPPWASQANHENKLELEMRCRSASLSLIEHHSCNRRATPAPATVTGESFQLSFDYRPNAPPKQPYCPSTHMPSGATVVFGVDLGLCGLLPAEQLGRVQKPWRVPDTDLGGDRAHLLYD